MHQIYKDKQISSWILKHRSDVAKTDCASAILKIRFIIFGQRLYQIQKDRQTS